MQTIYYSQIENLSAMIHCIQKMRGIDEDDYDLMDSNVEKLMEQMEHWDDDIAPSLEETASTSSQRPMLARNPIDHSKKSKRSPSKALSIASDDYEETMDDELEVTNQRLVNMTAALTKRPIGGDDVEDNESTEPKTKVSRNNLTYFDLQNVNPILEKETVNETIAATAFSDNAGEDYSRDNIYYSDTDSNSNSDSVSLLASCPRLEDWNCPRYEDWNYIIHCSHSNDKCCGCGQTNPPGQICLMGLFSCPLSTVYKHTCSNCYSL